MLKIGPIPVLGLGTWQLNGPACIRTVQWALEIGYTHIDTADVYENHREVGKGIVGHPREKLFITSKLMNEGLIASNVLSTTQRFLQELNTPYLDLLLVHWPDSSIQMEKTLEQMVQAQKNGLTKYIGVSNFTIQHLRQLKPYGFPLLTNQVEMHIELQQQKLLDYCTAEGISITAYCPIQRGSAASNGVLAKIGKSYGKSAIQVALRWLIQKEVVAVPKATSKEHLLENFEVFDFQLTPKEMETIAALDQQNRIVNPSWAEFS